MADAAIKVIQNDKDVTTPIEAVKVKLEQCEQIIKRGLSTFLEVGEALATIRDNELYKVTHNTWEKYCNEKWDLSKMHAHRQVRAYETVCLLKSKSNQLVTYINPDQQEIILPLNEAQTRPLTDLSLENQSKAWDLVLEQLNEGKKLTAALVKKAAREVRGDVVKKRDIDTKARIESTHLVSNRIKNLYLQMLEAICDERNAGWKSSKKKVVVSHLHDLIRTAKGEE